MPSIVVRLLPSAWTANIVQLFTALPSTRIVQAPHWLVSHPTWVPVSPATFRSRGEALAFGLDREHRAALHRLAVDEDRAGPALAGVASDMGAREPGDVPISW